MLKYYEDHFKDCLKSITYKIRCYGVDHNYIELDKYPVFDHDIPVHKAYARSLDGWAETKSLIQYSAENYAIEKYNLKRWAELSEIDFTEEEPNIISYYMGDLNLVYLDHRLEIKGIMFDHYPELVHIQPNDEIYLSCYLLMNGFPLNYE